MRDPVGRFRHKQDWLAETVLFAKDVAVCTCVVTLALAALLILSRA